MFYFDQRNIFQNMKTCKKFSSELILDTLLGKMKATCNFFSSPPLSNPPRNIYLTLGTTNTFLINQCIFQINKIRYSLDSAL